jgi:serine/threonine-protein kinase
MAQICSCPFCGTALQIQDQYMGREVKCAKCMKAFVATDVSAKGTAISPPDTQGYVTWHCAECGRSGKAEASMAGKSARCPCTAKVVIGVGPIGLEPKRTAEQPVTRSGLDRRVQDVPVETDRRTEDRRREPMPTEHATQLTQGIKELIPGFELHERLGSGGMGSVYKAWHKGLEMWVAVKVMKSLPEQGEDYVQRFLNEARTTGRLRHGNIVSALDCGETDGHHYLVMEYVEGQTVHDMVKGRGALPEEEVLRIVRQVAEGLQAALDVGIVHRDIKPHNILVNADGVAKICDLGLSRDTQQDIRLTTTGFFACTPAYASPEQARGDRDIDTRSDLYSLGITMYEMLTGELPFSGDSANELLIKQATEPAPPPNRVKPELSKPVTEIVMMLLRKDRKRRLQKPETLVKAIDRVLSGNTAPASGRERTGSSGRLSRTRPAETGEAKSDKSGIVIGVSIAAALLLVVVGNWVMGGEAPSPASAPGEISDERVGEFFAENVTENISESEPNPNPETQGILEIAVVYARENPDDFEGVQQRYEAAIAEFTESNPEMEDSANELLDRYIADYDDRAGQYFQDLKRAADPHVRAGDFYRAYSILIQFAERFPHSREHMGSYQNMIGDLFDRELKKRYEHFAELMLAGKYRRIRKDVEEIADSFGVSKELTPDLFDRLQATVRLIDFEEEMHLEGETILRNWNVLETEALSERLAAYQTRLNNFYPDEESRLQSIGSVFATQFVEKLRWETFSGWEVYYEGTVFINSHKEVEMDARQKTSGFIRRTPGKNFSITCEFLVQGGVMEWAPHLTDGKQFYAIALSGDALPIQERVWNKMIFQVREGKIIVKLNDLDPVALKAPKNMPASGPTGFFLRKGFALVRNLKFHAQ